jgi:GT2 family glycosyltransferase
VLELGVVLFHNSPRQLHLLVRSIELNRSLGDAPPFELAFFDNSGSPELRDCVEALAPGSGYRHAGANLGFGAAHNILMAEAFARPAVRFYICVNPDSMLHPQCLRQLVAEATRSDGSCGAGLVDARLLPEEHPKPYHPVSHETPWCTGTLLLVSRELHQAIGGFDERFFLYCEDVDLSWRARSAGFCTRLAPAALVHHHAEGRAIEKGRELHVRRSAAYLALKYGASAFAAERVREYEALSGSSPELPPAPPQPGATRHADFRHLFHFAQPRW